ncbi:low specificity L-threonine aldolase [Ancylobacter sp. TS-1]|uniref:threonine aldolase family protein n=1 Tax=Ancylobacter sp. TS-1 TaxID=1850374 RepID=UPI001265ACDD|nr:low specificity L-threonine aldolase [Ancylobacter sp. TS-1]QFR33815.1 low specificity L-threonine aldolase [Ancylobacter sp. TS-1]
MTAPTPPNRRPPGFGSDNVAGVSPAILAALAAANDGPAPSYGADEISTRVEARLSALFEREVAVFLVSTGTAANALSLAVLTPPWGAVLCHADSHVENDECGAPEFFSGGAKLVHVPGAAAKIDPDALAEAARRNRGDVHCVQPSVVSITQASELGTLYSVAETAAIGAVCRQAGLPLHMDGSRFANAVAALKASPAELTWKAGVDILSFGATKNGALGVEAIVLFDRKWADELAFRRKRAGHLSSKMRFLAAQMDAYLAGDLWLANARQANAMAARLDAGLRAIAGVAVQGEVEANMLFVRLPQPMIDGLLAQGFRFYTDRWGEGVVRLVTSFATSEEDVDRLVEAAAKLA